MTPTNPAKQPDDTEILSRLGDLLRSVTGAGPKDPEVAPDAQLLKDGMLDSISMVVLVVKTEKEFGITIPTGAFEPSNFSSLRRLARLVGQRLVAGPAA